MLSKLLYGNKFSSTCFVQIWDFASAEKIRDVPEDVENSSQV